MSEVSFSHLRSKLSIEWLKRFRELEFEPLNKLFDIAVQYGNRNKLNEIIAKRCEKIMAEWPNLTGNEDIEKKRNFWFVRAWYFINNAAQPYWEWFKADKNNLFELYERSGRLHRGNLSYWPKLTSSMVEDILDAFIDKWPKVDLPSSYGTSSPKGEKAYRFLIEVIWYIDSDDPDEALPVLDRLLADSRFACLEKDLKSIQASQLRKKALRDFEPPTPEDIVNRLDRDTVVTVEGLRQIVIQELQDFQKVINGGEFNSVDRFYEKGERLNEIQSTQDYCRAAQSKT